MRGIGRPELPSTGLSMAWRLSNREYASRLIAAGPRFANGFARVTNNESLLTGYQSSPVVQMVDQIRPPAESLSSR